ncbi:flavin reductase family protein [Streptomyces sp. NPDC020965]|uniref:flavin reductase family protein n=1 Tax=Streptomyces sp. NPDC020965 TaxID=3365105 RepID=UPI00378F40FE
MSTLPRADRAADVMDADHLRRAFGAFATGVTVVTVRGPSPRGMTANSFTAVSLDPALVLVCVDRGAVTHRILEAADGFGVSVLGEGQEDMARHFADRSRPMGADQFAAVDWHPGPATGAPLIDGALAQFECETWRQYDGGDHTIFLGRVLTARRSPERDALVFLGGRFRSLGPEREGAA